MTKKQKIFVFSDKRGVVGRLVRQNARGYIARSTRYDPTVDKKIPKYIFCDKRNSLLMVKQSDVTMTDTVVVDPYQYGLDINGITRTVFMQFVSYYNSIKAILPCNIYTYIDAAPVRFGSYPRVLGFVISDPIHVAQLYASVESIPSKVRRNPTRFTTDGNMFFCPYIPLTTVSYNSKPPIAWGTTPSVIVWRDPNAV